MLRGDYFVYFEFASWQPHYMFSSTCIRTDREPALPINLLSHSQYYRSLSAVSFLACGVPVHFSSCGGLWLSSYSCYGSVLSFKIQAPINADNDIMMSFDVSIFLNNSSLVHLLFCQLLSNELNVLCLSARQWLCIWKTFSSLLLSFLLLLCPQI